MSLTLGIHPGHHDACAALYDGYKLVAAVALERLTRRKIDGGRVPDEAIEFVGPCTFCGDSGFASYRRDGANAGRQSSWIGIET